MTYRDARLGGCWAAAGYSSFRPSGDLWGTVYRSPRARAGVLDGSFHRETVEFPAGFFPIGFYFRYPGGGWAALQRGNQLIEVRPLTFGDDLHSAVPAVANPPGQPQARSPADDESSKTNALYASFHDGVQTGDICFVHKDPFISGFLRKLPRLNPRGTANIAASTITQGSRLSNAAAPASSENVSRRHWISN